MKNTLLLLCICCSGILTAQQSRSALCNYAQLLTQGQAFVKNKDYGKALLKFNSARRCDPSKGEEIDAEIQKVFDNDGYLGFQGRLYTFIKQECPHYYDEFQKLRFNIKHD